MQAIKERIKEGGHKGKKKEGIKKGIDNDYWMHFSKINFSENSQF